MTAGSDRLDKGEILRAIVSRLEQELAAIKSAALATHAEATSEENKPENKYDTRGLEASYLAHGQSKAAEEAALALTQFRALSSRDFGRDEPVGLGALVVLEGASHQLYFVGPRAGGTEVSCGGQTIMVVTPQSPLGRQLVGKRTGAALLLEAAGRRNSYRLAEVR